MISENTEADARRPVAEMTPGQLVRNTVAAAILFGIGVIFFLNGRSPGWQPFAVVSGLAALSMFSSALTGRGRILSTFSLVVLLLAMFWKPGQPWAAVAGAVIVLLNALSLARAERVKQEDQAFPVPPESGDEQGYVGI
jgi:hypothetical protein